MDDLTKRTLDHFSVHSDPWSRDACQVIEAQADEIERLRSRDWIGKMLRWDDDGDLYLGPFAVASAGNSYTINTGLGKNDKLYRGYFYPDGEWIGPFDTQAEARAAVEKAVREALTVKDDEK